MPPIFVSINITFSRLKCARRVMADLSLTLCPVHKHSQRTNDFISHRIFLMQTPCELKSSSKSISFENRKREPSL